MENTVKSIRDVWDKIKKSNMVIGKVRIKASFEGMSGENFSTQKKEFQYILQTLKIQKPLHTKTESQGQKKKLKSRSSQG